jgi:hypothetical protein
VTITIRDEMCENACQEGRAGFLSVNPKLEKGKDLKTFLDRAGLFKSFYPISPGVAVKYANLYSLKEFG